MNNLSNIKVADAFKHLDPNEGLADGLSSGFASLRYKGKMWSLNLGGKSYPIKDDKGYNSPYVDFIILNVQREVSKIFFGEWNDDAPSGPICASVKGDVPDPGVPIPQSKTCATCENNEWATKPGGQRYQACQSHKRAAILLMPDMTKKFLPAPLMEPVYFKVPPGSFRPWKKFSDELQVAGIPASSVITRVSFVEGQLFEMKFDVLQGLTNAEAPLVLPMKESPQTLSIIGGMAGAPRQIAAPPPPPRAPERIETGLLEAFGAPAAAEPAPKKTRAKKVEPVQLDLDPARSPPADPEADAPWEESDSDLDAAMAKLMGDKMNNMLK